MTDETKTGMRTAAYFAHIWEKVIAGGDTVISTRAIDAFVCDLLRAFREAESHRAPNPLPTTEARAKAIDEMCEAAILAIGAEDTGRISEQLGLGIFEAEEIGKIRAAAARLKEQG